MFETFSHTADLGLRVRAADLPTLLAEAGRGLCAMIVANLADVRPVQQETITIEGTDADYLLFDWLTELLYRFDTEHLLLAEFDVEVNAGGLKAVCRGERLDRTRHQLEHEVKAITYHALTVQQTDNGWLAEVIVDI